MTIGEGNNYIFIPFPITIIKDDGMPQYSQGQIIHDGTSIMIMRKNGRNMNSQLIGNVIKSNEFITTLESKISESKNQ